MALRARAVEKAYGETVNSLLARLKALLSGKNPKPKT
jgi:hypothetical protein